MPYVRRGASHRPFTLSDYVHAVQSQRGMGQDDSGIDVGYTTPTTDQLPVTTPPSLLNLPSALPSTISTPTTPTTTTGLNLASLLGALSQGAVAGTKIYQSVQTPSLIPGTNVVYNPATGQTYNPLTGQVIAPAGSSVGVSPYLGQMDWTSIMPLLILGGGVLLIVGMMGRR